MPGVDKSKIQRFQKGELKFVQVFNINAAQIASLLACGHNYFSEGKLDEARKIFEGLAVLDPGNPYVQTMLGAIYQHAELFDWAILRYTMALKIFPQDITALTNRAELFLKEGRFLEAASDLRQAIDFDPQKKHPTSQRARLLAIIAAKSLQSARQNRK